MIKGQRPVPSRHVFVNSAIDNAKPIGNDRAADYFRRFGILNPKHSGVLYNPAVEYWRKNEAGHAVYFGEYPAMVCIMRDAAGQKAGVRLMFFDLPDMHPRVRTIMLHDNTGGAIEVKSAAAFSAGVCIGFTEAMAIRDLYPDIHMYALLTAPDLMEFVPPAKWDNQITLFRTSSDSDPMFEYREMLIKQYGYAEEHIDSYPPDSGTTWVEYVSNMPRKTAGVY